MSLDTQKLIKLLNLSSSPEDGEALSAIRKANEMIKAEGLIWNQIFVGAFKQAEVEPAPHREEKPDRAEVEIRDMIDELMDSLSPGATMTFVESINSWYNEKRFLTTKQRRALENLFERICGV